MPIEAGLFGFAAGAAVATFFSPCVYALLPAYLGYVAQDVGTRPGLGAALSRGIASAIGAIAAFSILGAIALVVGDTLRQVLPAVEVGIGLLLVALGLAMVTSRFPHRTVSIPRPSGSLSGFVAFGAGYAAAGAGCVAPVFFAVIVLAAGAPTSVGVGVLTVYAGAFAVMLVAATLVAAMGVELAGEHIGGVGARLGQLAGIVITVGGVVQVAIGLGWNPPLV